MGKEIERKFLVADDGWRDGAGEGTVYQQGYLSLDPERTVRVRLAGQRGFLTVKGSSRGAARSEFEFEIPPGDAADMLDHLCLRPLIEKTRYRIAAGGKTWELDEFAGENDGLLLAELELRDEGERFEKPLWAGEEVTGDPRYYNATLVSRPYSRW
jgi:adenylate cyclase